MATCADCDCVGKAGQNCDNIMCRKHCMEYGYFQCMQRSHYVPYGCERETKQIQKKPQIKKN